MRKKIVYGTIVLIVLGSICFVVFDCLLWRSFGFRYCSAPRSLHVSNLEVEENACRITVEAMTSGSFSTPTYNGLTFVFDDGVLTIGVHKGLIGGTDKLCEEIAVDHSITEVRLCGGGSEQVLFQK